MGDGVAPAGATGGQVHPSAPERSRFALAPPRHFHYPAVLLLLAEEPRHGYRLVDALLALGFGPVDRPTVYRALADLEHDGLLTSWSAPSSAGSARHVYAVTPTGRAMLAQWMDVLDEERESLERVLKRYASLDPDDDA